MPPLLVPSRLMPLRLMPARRCAQEEPQLFAIERVLEDHILEFGTDDEHDFIRAQLADKPCRAVLNEYEKTLRTVYDKWAESDARDTKCARLAELKPAAE